MSRHVTKEEYLNKNNAVERKKMVSGLIIVLIVVLISSVGQIMLKQGVSNVGGLKLSEIFSLKLFSVLFYPLIFFGILFYAGAMILWLVGLSTMDVSFMYPLISMGYIITTFFAVVFLNEQVTLVRWLGVILIVLGAFLILRT